MQRLTLVTNNPTLEPSDEILPLPPPLSEDASWSYQSQEAAEARPWDYSTLEAVSLVGEHKAEVEAASRLRISRGTALAKRSAKTRRVCTLFLRPDVCGPLVDTALDSVCRGVKASMF